MISIRPQNQRCKLNIFKIILLYSIFLYRRLRIQPFHRMRLKVFRKEFIRFKCSNYNFFLIILLRYYTYANFIFNGVLIITLYQSLVKPYNHYLIIYIEKKNIYFFLFWLGIYANTGIILYFSVTRYEYYPVQCKGICSI